MELIYLGVILLILGIILFVVFLFLTIIVGRTEGRKKTYLKVAKEFGLTYKTHSYKANFPILPNTLYPAREVSGSINGNIVKVSDMFAGQRLPGAQVKPFALTVFHNLANHPFISNFLPASLCLNTTQIEINGVPQFLNTHNEAEGAFGIPTLSVNITPKSFPLPASYEQIKQAITEIK